MLAAVATLNVVGNAASGATYSDAFPSSGSTVIASVGVIDPGEFGYFWSVSRGDNISESFSGTGLASVSKLDLDFDVTRNVLSSGAFTNWDVLVNGNVVGSWSWDSSDGTGNVTASYTFPDIVGSGNYAVRMEVTNEVPGGAGSIAIGFPGDLTLTGVVPEPATFVLAALGLMGMIAGRQRRDH
jgi:hypothetical protein